MTWRGVPVRGVDIKVYVAPLQYCCIINCISILFLSKIRNISPGIIHEMGGRVLQTTTINFFAVKEGGGDK